MNKNKNRTRRSSGILAVVIALSFVGETSVYAQQTIAVKPSAEIGAINVNGPKDAVEVETFLDMFFAKEKIKQKASAVAISVVRKGQVLLSKGYGVEEQKSKSPVDAERTTFRIASISKVFTAAAAMQLIEQGKLSLQDDIEKYLDGYKITNPFQTPVTIEDLLTHSTGFESTQPSDASYLTDQSIKPISLKKSIFDAFPKVVREPGTSYMYDNFASRLLGYIVQQVSGESFGEYVQRNIFEPIGMKSSSFTLTKELAGRMVTSYDPENNALPQYDLSPREWPEGSMISTASDMMLFMQTFLNGGRTAGGKVILSPASVKAMSTYHVAIHPDFPDMTYGFESPIEPNKTNGENVISKGGDITGFSSLLWMLPDNQTGVFVTYNANSDLRNDLFAAFMDHYYSGKPTTFEQKGFQSQTKAELAKFEGLYSDLRTKFLTRVEATSDGTLTVSDVTERHQLKQVGDLIFVDELGKPLAFNIDKDKQVTDLKYLNLFSYAVKLKEVQDSFPDVPANHPYSTYIFALKSLGLLSDDPAKLFEPQQSVTRGAFVHAFNAIWGIQPSSNPALFKDIDGSTFRGDIQAAAESGLLYGTSDGLFEPDRPILREEAAIIAFRLLAGNGIKEADASASLESGTSKWAVEAVSSAIKWKMHGPEVTESKGKIDYGSQRVMNKQEMAAFLFSMLLPS
ncbi:beta-lactamase family protein [Paenibacillus pabuli]|uniref:beta-lactamase family protein n=1 Tax=Paenibacillus pabuli TaxID=1472 RepID=UPI001FFF8128|nr:beta-lactamase family protein [Paenibacillus pabuli]UPK41543.1 serine hydrolase [Paenibacillus pabuli]